MGSMMTEALESKGKYVKRTTMISAAVVSLVIGFIGGVMVTVYKSDAGFGRFQREPVPRAVPQIKPKKTAEIDAAEKAAASRPDNADVWKDLGNLYFDSSRFKEAARAYEKSLEIDKGNPNIWTDLGIMYRKLGNPKKAIDAFDQAMAIDPKHEASRFNKGIVLLHDLNRMEAAVEAWEALLKINPLAVTPSGQSLKELLAYMKSHVKK
jgi:tetratricopeptide (TPR) repeat protein